MVDVSGRRLQQRAWRPIGEFLATRVVVARFVAFLAELWHVGIPKPNVDEALFEVWVVPAEKRWDLE